MNKWQFEGKDFDLEDHTPVPYGFVYIITHKPSGKKYIGRKFFSMAGYKTVKGVKKKIRKESDWQKYYGSSPAIKKLLIDVGPDVFEREIVKLCYNRSSCSYYETKLIFEKDAILSDQYINDWVTCKISAMHVNAIKRG